MPKSINHIKITSTGYPARLCSTECPYEYTLAFDNIGEQIAWDNDDYDDDGFSIWNGKRICRYPYRIIDIEMVKNSINSDPVYAQSVINSMVEDGILHKVYDDASDSYIYFIDEFEERFGFFDNYHCAESHYE